MTHRITFLKVKEEAHRIYDFLRTLGWEKVSPMKSNRAAVLAEPVPVQATKRAAPKAAAAPEPAATPATPAPVVSKGKWWERVGLANVL